MTNEASQGTRVSVSSRAQGSSNDNRLPRAAGARVSGRVRRCATLGATACALLVWACSDLPVEPEAEAWKQDPLFALLGPVAQVSVGEDHTCALGSDGAIACWGSGFRAEATAPVGTFTQVDAGGDHSCAVRTDETLACWGNNDNYQVRPPTGSFTQVSAGSDFNCALRTDGTAVCWGTIDDDGTLVTPPPGSFTQVSAGHDHACGVRPDASIACWGDDQNGETAAPAGPFTQVSTNRYFSCGVSTNASIVCWGTRIWNLGVTNPPAGQFTHVSAGNSYACAVRLDGSVACWGNNAAAAPQDAFRQISAGSHNCGVRTDGSVACWGATSPRQTVLVTGAFSAATPGGSFVNQHACALELDGDIACWGDNNAGQASPPAGMFAQVSAGIDYTCALAANASISCWGLNSAGQTSSPPGAFAQLSAGDAHACAVKADGSVACWGSNDAGQASAAAGTFTQVDAGAAHSCGLKNDGSLACWGSNASGQVTPPAGTFTQVSAGSKHSCAVRSNGTVGCWGDNAEDQATPPAGTFTHVGAGDDNSCGIRTDGSIACWGSPWPEWLTRAPGGSFTQLSVGPEGNCAVAVDHTLECWGRLVATTYVPGSSVPPVLVGAGDIASCTTNRDEATAELLDDIAGHVFTLGDNAYADGSAADFTNCYGPTWGRHTSRTRPAAGDKEYRVAGAPGYFGYFGTAAGDAARGYYSYDIPNTDWHVVVLNSSVAIDQSSAQIAWLKSDLAASPKQCTVAYWHKPRFYSAGVAAAYKPAWDVLYAAGVDVVINGDRRNYERFAPQEPNGIANPAYGIRQFIAGTGGAGSTAFGAPLANSEVRIADTPGVLKLTLEAAGYAWEFVPIAGRTATDQGTASCHGEPPPVANPGGVYTSEAAVTFDASASSDPQGDMPLTYAWSFGDGTSATGPKPTHAYAADGSYSVSLVVIDAKGNRSAPATTTAIVGDQAPTAVDAGPRLWATSGETFSFSGSFADGRGAPWSYHIAWGDGSEDTGTAGAPGAISATHSYATAGNHTITLTVTSTAGGSNSDQTIVHVTPPGATFTLLAAGNIARCGSGHNQDEATVELN